MLYGREAELARLQGLIEGARRGSGGALAVTGEAGVGKTALLTECELHSDGMRTLSTAGLEAESRLPFSALAELAEPLLGGLESIPAAQAAALEAALALGPPAKGDRFAAYAGFFGLLAGAAEERPLLVLVDDAQWLDPASAECLAFASRRLADKAIALVVAARSEEPHAFGGPGVIQLQVARLERGAAQALLADVEPDLAPMVAGRLLDAAAGNPLALIELPSLLTSGQRDGTVSLEEPLRPGATLERAFARRIGRLPAPAREALLVAATAFTPAVGPVVAACSTMGVGPGALELAETEGIVTLSPERVEFSHPLLRGAVYEGAPAAARRRAHRALADHADEDARALHLAAAALGPDTEVADALEAAAHGAAARGAHATASETLERASRLSEESDARSVRLFAAGLEAALGGAYDRSGSLLEMATEIEDPLMRASARHLLALVTLNGGVRSALANHRLMTEEAERILPLDGRIAAALHAGAAAAATVGGHFELVLASAERAQAVLPEDADAVVRCQALAMVGMGLMLRGEVARARETLDEAGRLLRDVDPVSPAAQQISLGLGARLGTGQEQILRKEALALVEAVRHTPTPGLLPYFEALAADAAYRIGDWDACAAEIAESLEIAEDSGQAGPLSIGLTIAARIWSSRGDEAAARAALERAITIAEPVGYGSTIIRAHWTLGFLELGLSRTSEAIAELEETERLVELSGLEEPVLVAWAPELVEAYSRAGRQDDARRVAAEFAQRARRSATPLALALSARSEGLVAEGAFEEHFERALALHDQVRSPFERARTLLAYGSRLHRARRRVEARKRLRAAQAILGPLGARPWVEQADAELRAAGAIKREPVADPDALTAQELRVALAVARGATNRQVAAELFLSPKTIEFHLGRVYRKLGIHSRAELATVVAEGRLGDNGAEATLKARASS